jgi:hypothetical protein
MDTMQRFTIRAIVLFVIVMLLWAFGVLRSGPPIVSSETLMAQSVQTTPPQQGSPMTPEQQQQVSKMPTLPEDRRVKAENIDSVMSMGDVIVLDVREPKEIEELGGYEGAINIPVTELEKRLGELPKDKTILTA